MSNIAEFHQVSSLLKKIYKLAHQIVLLALPIMQDLIKTDSEVLEQILECRNDWSRETALEWARNEMVARSGDADNILQEYPKLMTKTDSTYVVVPDEGCPFFLQVWNGDVYDVTEKEALQELYNDLVNQKKMVSISHLLELAETIVIENADVDISNPTPESHAIST